MKEENSALHLIQAIEDGLQAWQQDTQSPGDSPATSQQSQIGWDAALNGWLQGNGEPNKRSTGLNGAGKIKQMLDGGTY